MNGGDMPPSIPSTYCSSSCSSVVSCSSSASTQFIRRGVFVGLLYVLFGLFLHTFPKWPVIPSLLHCFPFALHVFNCSMVKFSMPQRRGFFLLFILVHTGSIFICGFVSLYDFCRIIPSSNAIANAIASRGFALGSVQSFSYTVRLFMFSMKISCTKLSVWVPKSHSAASPFNECQNCSKDSVCICFRDRNRNLSRVWFLSVSNVSLQLFSKFLNDISAIFAFGYLSINVSLAAVIHIYRISFISAFLLFD